MQDARRKMTDMEKMEEASSSSKEQKEVLTKHILCGGGSFRLWVSLDSYPLIILGKYFWVF